MFLDQIVEDRPAARRKPPLSARISPSGLDRWASQELKAATRASRSMKLFWRASSPKRRLTAVSRNGRDGTSAVSGARRSPRPRADPLGP